MATSIPKTTLTILTMLTTHAGCVSLALCMTACAGANSGVPTHANAARLTATALYPLHLGCAWSYDVDSGDGQPVLATARVLSVEHGVVAVQTGQGLQRYYSDADHIQRVGQPHALLRAPFSVGSHWRSGADSEARVIAVGQTRTTPAGAFDACVVVEEVHSRSQQQVTTTYCPGVGPVRIDSQIELRSQRIEVHATLRGFSLEAL